MRDERTVRVNTSVADIDLPVTEEVLIKYWKDFHLVPHPVHYDQDNPG